MKKRDKYKIECEIEVAFSRVIGPLSIMKELDSYKRKRNEISNLLKIIIKWGTKFQINRNLFFISREELLDVFYRFEELKTTFLFDKNMGIESELSDEITIWYWEIMNLRKEQIDNLNK